MGSLEERLRSAVDPLDTFHREAPAESRRVAAVLMLFDTRNNGLPLLFLERTAHLRHHAGQIGFPGGGAEPGDSGAVATALREAGEEAGIPADAVEVIGLLPPLLTATSDNWLTPVVGLQQRDIELRPDPFEVARLFRLELDAIMEAPHTVRTLTHEGRSRRVHFYELDGNLIWGVTAAIVAELISRVQIDPD
ncbi:MAG: CoA pyrophosphatase [Candidatus Dormibacteraeota bacterium]|uniref:CoA pyrophosphatase n=1 Tax=Candidatus Aeolococcus gillhamiae TaxID=3127015 RepID=A0A2W5Z069_9BACT|nr:CoA pyrophosphatase [Candidatus Dormibacteraeota bacterium]PZR78679.1 MAG: coenzyme A pyrophosphatase [Candidatus Dormibacter sp. RRmetagenome_bin12]